MPEKQPALLIFTLSFFLFVPVIVQDVLSSNASVAQVTPTKRVANALDPKYYPQHELAKLASDQSPSRKQAQSVSSPTVLGEVAPINLTGSLSLTSVTSGYNLEGGTAWEFTYSESGCSIAGAIYKPSGSGVFPGVVVNHGAGNNATDFLLHDDLKVATGFFGTSAYPKYVSIAVNLAHAGNPHAGGANDCGGQSQDDASGNVVDGSSWENAYRVAKTIDILQSQNLINSSAGEIVDRDNVYMYGNSMGGHATMAASSQLGARVKAYAMTASGYYNGSKGPIAPKGVPPLAPGSVDGAYLAMNGSNDPIQPAFGGSSWIADVAAGGTQAEYIEYANQQHGLFKVGSAVRDDVIQEIHDWFGGSVPPITPTPTDTPVATATPTDIPSSPALGDANGDGDVDHLDFDIVASNYGVSEVNCNTIGDGLDGDLNGDCVVNLTDINLHISTYGSK